MKELDKNVMSQLNDAQQELVRAGKAHHCGLLEKQVVDEAVKLLPPPQSEQLNALLPGCTEGNTRSYLFVKEEHAEAYCDYVSKQTDLIQARSMGLRLVVKKQAQDRTSRLFSRATLAEEYDDSFFQRECRVDGAELVGHAYTVAFCLA